MTEVENTWWFMAYQVGFQTNGVNIVDFQT